MPETTSIPAETATYVVYDVEVTTRSPMGFAASPFAPDNEIVLSGWKYNDGQVVKMYAHHEMFPKAKLYVGCNIKFDLLWAARANGTTPARLVEGARVWDISLAQYLLSRQRERMPSLDRCAELHGFASHKHDTVSLQIKAGVCPSSIPLADLDQYHTADLDLTEQVFLSQFEEAKARGMLPLIWSQMQALVATCEMEHHGIAIDTAVLDKLSEEYTLAVNDAKFNFTRQLNVLQDGGNDVPLWWHDKVLFEDQISSPKSLSLLFFGGEVEYKEKEVVGNYKNGNVKYKTVDKKKSLRGCGLVPLAHGSVPNKNGYYTVDDAVLKSIATIAADMETRDTAEAIRKFRDANKQLTTYIDGVRQNIWPDGKVHCSFNHSVTLTGRLSCSNPNLQNQTDGPIKRVYVPSAGWKFVEFDYSQLEVVGLAVLSGDKQLLSDIASGVDIHSTLFTEMYHRTPTVAERKAFKPLTFGLIYGAGAVTLAQNSGRTLTEAKHFISVFYGRYKGVELYHNSILESAKAHRRASSRKTEKGFPAGVYVHRTNTGREYEFVEYDSVAHWKREATSFSPTELKNWPIQGFSTGDVVPLMLGYVCSEVIKSKWRDDIRMVVTVHDSIMFEVREGLHYEDCLNFLVELMSNTRQVIEDRFGIDVGLELNTEYKQGYNWKEMS